MNIEYLRFFYEVASVKSISKVANNSHISQPALSQQIHKLEDNLGYKLLDRSNKGVQLTEAGKIVEKYAKNILKVYENMLVDLNDISNNNKAIRIDAFPTMATYALPCTIYMIKEKYSNYNYYLNSDYSQKVESNIINDVCDVGFIEGAPDNNDLFYSSVGRDRMVIVAGKDYDIPDKIAVDELNRFPMILLIEEYKAQKVLEKKLMDLGFDIKKQNVLFSLDSIESIKTLLIKSLGISILPYSSIKKELYLKQLKEIKVFDESLEYDVNIIYKKDKEMDTSVKEFIDFFKKVGEKSFC
ncbi:putative Transcriptional regulator [Acetoanaerobium sticklandii]|uniref:Putative Transcriptional regulator n=1 Tax=Acetoanaerobium sticklandii (strain ATCC 12662 / DSM 519 / JCM 1433 / CCUG 9281 / NCIMB 10654 / HF) TaxID=499177 RepID=E3PRQ0_ACESD|nr:LysR family transcriptional regulator [Acetoanaerobium sticklandii]CBH21554.1 putative Transcriptional regulator [Acetoanaerobium sticklandii]